MASRWPGDMAGQGDRQHPMPGFMSPEMQINQGGQMHCQQWINNTIEFPSTTHRVERTSPLSCNSWGHRADGDIQTAPFYMRRR